MFTFSSFFGYEKTERFFLSVFDGNSEKRQPNFSQNISASNQELRAIQCRLQAQVAHFCEYKFTQENDRVLRSAC